MPRDAVQGPPRITRTPPRVDIDHERFSKSITASGLSAVFRNAPLAAPMRSASCEIWPGITPQGHSQQLRPAMRSRLRQAAPPLPPALASLHQPSRRGRGGRAEPRVRSVEYAHAPHETPPMPARWCLIPPPQHRRPNDDKRGHVEIAVTIVTHVA